MRTRTMILAGIVVILAVASGYAFRYSGAYGQLCDRLGGKWASVDGGCVTRSCYGTHSCGYWANPGSRCDRLKVGDPIAEVYFQLGLPDEVYLTRYIWQARKGAPVSAEIVRERLTSITCAS